MQLTVTMLIFRIWSTSVYDYHDDCEDLSLM